jgi:hypothetical protein
MSGEKNIMKILKKNVVLWTTARDFFKKESILHLYLNFNRNFNITALNCYFIDK